MDILESRSKHRDIQPASTAIDRFLFEFYESSTDVYNGCNANSVIIHTVLDD